MEWSYTRGTWSLTMNKPSVDKDLVSYPEVQKLTYLTSPLISNVFSFFTIYMG